VSTVAATGPGFAGLQAFLPGHEILATVTPGSPTRLSGEVSAAIQLDDHQHAKALTRQFITAFYPQLMLEAATGLDPAVLEVIRRHFLGLTAVALAQPDGAVGLVLAPRNPVQGGQLPEHLAAEIGALCNFWVGRLDFGLGLTPARP
jgi:hypothetical protein